MYSNSRVRSPITELNAAELYAACECYLQDQGISIPVDLGVGVTSKLKATTPCNEDVASQVSAGFTQDYNFCVFFSVVYVLLALEV